MIIVILDIIILCYMIAKSEQRLKYYCGCFIILLLFDGIGDYFICPTKNSVEKGYAIAVVDTVIETHYKWIDN